MHVSASATQLLLQAQPRNAGFDATMKDDAAQLIVDVTGSVASSKPQQSLFGVNTDVKPVFESVARYKTEDIFEQKDIVKKHDVFETRAIVEDQEILETKVAGTVDLSEAASLAEVGIKRGARFSIAVGDDAPAIVKFVNAKTISVKVDGVVENFTFKARNGSFRDGLQDALNTIDGITAGYNGDGRLTIEASDARSLSIADIGKSPLRRLGLTESVTEASVIGYRKIQTGTEQVKIGEEEVVIGSQTVKVGTEQVLDGYDQRIVGLKPTGTIREIDQGLMSSDTDYLEQLFSAIQTNVDRQSSLISSQEVWSAYDEIENDLGFFADVPQEDRWAAKADEDRVLM